MGGHAFEAALSLSSSPAHLRPGLELVCGFFPASPSRMDAHPMASALAGICPERLEFPFSGLWRKGPRENEEGKSVEFKAQSAVGDTSV